MRIRLSFDVNTVPKEWSVIPCGVFFKEKSIKNTEGEINLSVYRDYGVIPKDSRDDNHNKVSEDTSNYKLVEPGDFVLNKMKGWSGSLGVSDYRGIVSPSYTVLEPGKKIHNKYFHYLLRSESYRQMYESLSYGVRIGQWELRYHDFKQIPSLYPPSDEQKLISRHLDKKTKQIDRLVEKIEKKIELLKEQRTSLINQCVTKGLDPNVEMKDSGVEWIGEVPKHWSLSKLKYEGEFISGHSFDSDAFTENGEIRAVKISNIQNNGMFWEDLSFLPIEYWDQFREFRILKGDLLFVLTRPIISSGIKVTFYNEEYKSLLNQRNSIFRATETSLVKDYLFFVVRTQFFLNEFKSQLKETSQPNISTGQISNIRICIPPVSEQSKISQILSKKNNDFELLIKHEQTKIDLLKEYRQSLISSVVTGKVRVTEDMI